MASTVKKKFTKTFIHNRLSSDKLPFFGSLEVTRKCNSHCSFCPIGNEKPELKAGKEITTDEATLILDQYSEFNLIVVSFLGGEPTLRKDFTELGHYAREVGLISQAVTNGLTLADNVEDYTEAIDNLVVSLDTLDSQKYREIRGVDKFDDVIEGIEQAVKLQKKNKCVVLINTVICSANISEVPEIVKFAKEVGASGILVDFMTFHEGWEEITDEDSRYKPEQMDWRKNPKDVEKLVNKLIDLKKDYPILTSKSYLKTFITQNFHYRCYPYLFCCVNRFGHIALPCFDSSHTKFYSLLEGQHLKDIWFLPEVNEAREKVKDCKRCYMHCIVEPSKLVGEPFKHLGDLTEWVGNINRYRKTIF